MNEIRAFPLINLQSSEPLRAIRDLATRWGERATVLVWDINAGVREYPQWSQGANGRSGGGDPLGAVKALNEAPAPVILIALNYHFVLKSPQVIQALLDGCRAWSNDVRRFVIVTPPGVSLPSELERYVVVVDHDLPGVTELARLVRANAEANELEVSDEEVETIAHLGRGLTSYEFVNALALSIAETGGINRDAVANQKAQLVRKDAVLEWSRSDWKFADVGGLDRVKGFLKATCRHPLARGILCLGVPGVGKTMVAKALANEIGLPALQLQFSQVFGSLVGESEQRIHAALKVVEAMAPCVLIIDEIEKGLSGVQSSHRSDGGTASRVGESFLTWLNDRPADLGVYVVATCNDIDKLPPEFVRAERWDAIFFFDLPTQDERDEIAQIYAGEFEVDLDPRPDQSGWTGAEIKTAYRIAKMLSVPAAEAAGYVTPLNNTMREKIQALRDWAAGRCIPASTQKTQPGTETVRVLN